MTISWNWMGIALLSLALVIGCEGTVDDDSADDDDDAADDDAADDDAADDDGADDDAGDDDVGDDDAGDDDSGDDDMGDDDTGDDDTGDDDSAHQDDLQHVQSVVFTKYCASCHDGTHPTGLDLRDGQTYASTVGVASSQLPSMNRVTAGASATSYLWHKVNDTHVGEGGSGDHMPPTGMMPQGKRNKVQAWIDDGAMP